MFLKLLSAAALFIAVFLYQTGFHFDFYPNYTNLYQSFGNDGDKLFTSEELAKYNGVKSEELYLSLMGKVYDVTKGKNHYEPGASYNIFVGRDASKSFITGEFDENAKDLDDLLALTPKDLVGMESWIQLYEEQYTYKGKMIGRFYDKYGKETDYLKQVRAKIEEGKIERFKKEELSKMYPSCNSEWSADAGSRVWCSNLSGGIQRDWVGVPRQMHTPGLSEPHCVCINLKNMEHINNPQMKIYDNCDPNSESCNLKV